MIAAAGLSPGSRDLRNEPSDFGRSLAISIADASCGETSRSGRSARSAARAGELELPTALIRGDQLRLELDLVAVACLCQKAIATVP